MTKMRILLAIVLSISALTLGVYIGADSIHADEPDSEGNVVGTATVAMEVQSVLGVAMDTVYGNCGSLTLNLYNSGGGFLHWQTIITSTNGPLFSASYNGAAHNLDTGGGHYVSDSDSWIFSTSWQSDKAVYTGPGVIFGEILSASSTTINGTQCVAAGYPTDVVWVSN